MAGLDEVKVLAIVMLENRSFDHLLGDLMEFLYHGERESLHHSL
jgi:phospholipase C